MGGKESKTVANDSDSFESILQSISAKQTKSKVVLSAERSNLSGTISHFKQSGSELHPLVIQFAGDEWDFEYDHSSHESTSKGVVVSKQTGPCREFYTLLLKDLTKSKFDVFEGSGSVLLPVNNQKAIEGDLFLVFGKIAVSSIISGGPGFPYFPSYIVHFLQGREFMHEVVAEHIINTYLIQYIKDIENAQDQNCLDEVVSNDTERFTDNCGWGKERITLKSRKEFIEMLVQWDLFHKRRAALEQIQKGLNILDFLENTKHTREFERLFLCRDKRTSTAEYIKEKLVPVVEKLSPENSQEETTKKFTLNCLEMLEDMEASFLFQFISGLDDVPTTDIPFQVEFNRNNKQATLPEAITCSYCLILPLGNKTKLEFLSSFEKALKLGRVGFAGRK